MRFWDFQSTETFWRNARCSAEAKWMGKYPRQILEIAALLAGLSVHLFRVVSV